MGTLAKLDGIIMNSGKFLHVGGRKKKHLLQENAPEKKFMMNEGVEKNNSGNTKFTQKPSPYPIRNEIVACIFYVFRFSDNSYCGPVSKKENYIFF